MLQSVDVIFTLSMLFNIPLFLKKDPISSYVKKNKIDCSIVLVFFINFFCSSTPLTFVFKLASHTFIFLSVILFYRLIEFVRQEIHIIFTNVRSSIHLSNNPFLDQSIVELNLIEFKKMHFNIWSSETVSIF